MHPDRLARLKTNSSSKEFEQAVGAIRSKADMAIDIPYSIGAHEHALWGHYYNCDIHAVKLFFDWNKPEEHRCPICDKRFSGTIYDGAWVGAAHYRIANGLENLGLYALISGEKKYVEKALSFMRQYAEHYIGYSVHGGIPYNGPGKLFQQTLDESHWLISNCLAYSAINKHISLEDRQWIEQGLIRPCANFLIEHKEQQLHNHSVLITAAIAMSGFLLEDQEIHNAGLHGEYGLLDQIQRGVLQDGFWYEGSFSYHFYAMNPIIYYCLLTEGTDWDLRRLPQLKAMFDFPLRFILPDGKFPNWNDSTLDKGIADFASYYEVALDWYGDQLYREVLEKAKSKGRSSLFALLFGDSDSVNGGAIGNLDSLIRSSSATTGKGSSGSAKLVNRNGWYLSAKHAPFGGEHDHMDRLSISFGFADQPLFTDMATVQYAVPAHYAWYKHTYSHNTVGIDGCDQPPQDACLSGFGEAEWGSWCSGYVEFGTSDWWLKDKIILPDEMATWDEEAYRGVTLSRLNLLTNDYLIDVVQVDAPIGKRIDLLSHMNANLKHGQDWRGNNEGDPLCKLSPELFKEIRTVAELEHENVHMLEWSTLEQQVWCSHKLGLWTALTPSNPATENNQSLAERVVSDGTSVRFINVYQPRNDSKGAWELVVEQSTKEGLELLMSKGGQRVRTSIRLRPGSPALEILP